MLSFRERTDVLSWGRVVRQPQLVANPRFADELPALVLDSGSRSRLTVGLRRSCKNSCLTGAGALIDMRGLCAAAGLHAVRVFALYISSTTMHRRCSYPQALWLVWPILVYWIGRAIIMAERRLIDDDPILFALRDRVSLLAFAAIAAVMIIAAA
ncbi:hypothetical protein [Roseiarcus sp.]|uniref:hypothetical protein n=1 Tax=Roseiarcus sp. TaxID=1969460 RepID=UPI003F96E2E3